MIHSFDKINVKSAVIGDGCHVFGISPSYLASRGVLRAIILNFMRSRSIISINKF